MELPQDPPEEIFVHMVFIFVGWATPFNSLMVKIFADFIFAIAGRSAKTTKICTPQKFPAIQ